MKAKWKKLAVAAVSCVMASTMAFSFAACGGKGKTREGDDSSEVYNSVLGEFYEYYSKAKNKENTLAERFALMAQAEAKLYESGVLLPTQANGGNYAVSKAANATVSSVAWGNDSDREHYMVVANTPIKKTDRQALKEYYNDASHATQSGADYIAHVKSYLESKGYTLKDTYNRAYTSDPTTFDVLATSQQSDTEPVVQTFDGLVEYDVKNHMQPAMATAIPSSVASDKNVPNPAFGEDEVEDTVTFTFQIRTGQQWVDNQGRKVADFKAEDFATGFQHMLDAEGGLEWLVDGVVVGVDEYLGGTVGFDKVGVKVDNAANTVTYQVYQSAESYFLTMLSYSVFAPLSKEFYESKGGKLGKKDFDASAETYSYGKTSADIAYCGPYIISEHTKENKITFTANSTWWNSNGTNARNVQTINWHYNDGKDVTKAYNDFKANTIDGCGLTGANVTSAKTDKWSGDSESIFDTYAYTSAMDSTAFCAFLNVNRAAYANWDDGSVKSPQKYDEQVRTNAAMNNVNFRRALITSIDRKTYQSHVMGADLAETSISNMYTPGTFVSLPGEAKVKLNGTDKTYAAGTMYGEIVQDQLNADGVKITVWKKVDGAFTYTGFDGWYNADYAKAELELAVAALAEAGVTVDAKHPIQIDYPYFSTNANYTARANALKQGIETVLEGKVQINLVACDTSHQWQYAGYYTVDGTQSNYDVYDLSGWGPDYGDPQTYLDTMLPDYNGYMTKCLGLF